MLYKCQVKKTLNYVNYGVMLDKFYEHFIILE